MNITRRQFVPLAAASAMAAFGVAGCSNDTASTATGSTPAADAGSADTSSDGYGSPGLLVVIVFPSPRSQ